MNYYFGTRTVITALATYHNDSDRGGPGEADAETALVPLWLRLLSLAAGVPELTPLVGARAEHAKGSVLVWDEARPLTRGPLILAQLRHNRDCNEHVWILAEEGFYRNVDYSGTEKSINSTWIWKSH